MLEQSSIVVAKIKAQTIKHIFKDLGPKNLRGVQYFYAICSPQQLNLQFMSSCKDILITIILRRNLFQHYLYSKERPSLLKYALQDFSLLGALFENNKQVLELVIDEEGWRMVLVGGSGRTQFVAPAMSCDQDDEEFLIEEEDMRPPAEEGMQVRVGRVGVFESVLSYAKGCKLGSLWFRYDSVSQKLEVAEGREGKGMRWLLKIEEILRHSFNSQLEFPCKVLGCAINLLPNDSPLVLTFYRQFMLIDVPDKEKTFTIRLNARLEEVPL